MINNITQVSPRNGVDFSKIRKASQGIKIPKFQTPAGSIGGITHNAGTTWYNNVFSLFKDQISNELAAAKTPEEKQAVIDKYNNQQSAYGRLRPQFTNLASVSFNDDVKSYQDLINSDFGFVNTLGINNGVSTNRYNKVGSQNRIGKDLSDKWESDGYWGGQTQDRTTLGYAGDWDENSDEFKNWQEQLKQMGMETYKDTDNTYKLRLLTSDGGGNGGGNSGGNGGGQPSASLSGDYTPDEYTAPFKFTPEPFLTPNPFIAGLGLAANRHQFMNELNKKVPLLEVPYLQGKVTNNYAARQMRNQQMADIRSQAQRQLGSDMVQNQQYLQAVEQGLQPLENQNVVDQTQEFNQTSQNLQNIENQNKLASAQVANQNRTNLIADWNRRLDARSKYQWTRNNIKSDFINKTWTDYQQWAANEKNERDSALAAYNDYVAGIGIQNAKKSYEDLASDPMKSRSFATIYKKAFNDFDSNRGTDRTWANANPELDKIFGDETMDQNAKNQAFMDYLRTSNSDYATAFNKGWGSEVTTAKNSAIAAIQRIQNQLAGTYPSFRNTYIGGWGPWDTRRLGKKLTIYEKNGGILKMKNGSRFVDYLEHNRKAIKDQKQTTMEVSKQMERELKAQLDSIDRETLILLRSIFK